MIKKQFLNIALLVLFSICSIAYGNEDILNNQGSFEAEGFWNGNASYSIDKDVFKVDKASAKITAGDINNNKYIYCYLPMKAGERYKISLWFKTMNVVPDSSSVKMALNWNSKEGGNGSAGVKAISLPAGDNNTDWKEFSTIVMPPPETALCQLVISFGDIKGTLWLDGLTVSALGNENEQVATIRASSAPLVIDGRDNDPGWQSSAPMTGFFRADYEGSPAHRQTEVKLSYDATNLYVFIKCREPEIQLLTAKIKEKDGNVSSDDCVELFISPVYGKTYHFITNSIGTLYDSEINLNDQTMEGFVVDTTYNSQATVKSLVGTDYWSSEISIPLKNLTGASTMESAWKINFARSNKIAAEDSTYSRLIGAFYQPKTFSNLAFTKNTTSLTRASNIDFVNPLAIQRTKVSYEDILSTQPGNYTTYMWTHNLEESYLPKNLKDQLSAEKWKQEIQAQFEETGQAGMIGTPLPWADSGSQWWQTVDHSMEYYKKYGMKFKLDVESSHPAGVALRNGAEVLNKKAVDNNQANPIVSLIDPVYVDVVKREIVRFAERYKDVPYAGVLEGRDEPYIHPIVGKISDMGPMANAWNKEVTEKYGFGKYSMPAPDDASHWEHPETHPFQRIAFNNWMSDKYLESKKQMYETLKSVAPNMPYKGAQYWFMSGFIPYDYSQFGKYTDLLSCDPYASSAERREGRGIYNHGFATKLVKDLGKKPTTTVVQAFHYAGYTPKASDLREWVSQALKTGASGIEFYEMAEKYGNPELYKEMLRISKLVTSMKKVELPQNAATAIICSLDSEAAEVANGDQIYTAYSLLGEKVGSWFDFVSDKQLKRGEVNLSQYKIVYLPLAKYMEKPVVEKLTEYVNTGGTLVVGDPQAFSYSGDGTSLASYREKLVGAKLGKDTFKADNIRVTALQPLNRESFVISKENSSYDKIHLAHSLTFTANAHKVIAEFANGKPAVVENKYGKGKVIYFAANPFAPDVILINSKITALFELLQKNAGVETGLPRWNFLLPSTGGEIEVRHVLNP